MAQCLRLWFGGFFVLVCLFVFGAIFDGDCLFYLVGVFIRYSHIEINSEKYIPPFYTLLPNKSQTISRGEKSSKQRIFLADGSATVLCRLKSRLQSCETAAYFCSSLPAPIPKTHMA